MSTGTMNVLDGVNLCRTGKTINNLFLEIGDVNFYTDGRAWARHAVNMKNGRRWSQRYGALYAKVRDSPHEYLVYRASEHKVGRPPVHTWEEMALFLSLDGLGMLPSDSLELYRELFPKDTSSDKTIMGRLQNWRTKVRADEKILVKYKH